MLKLFKNIKQSIELINDIITFISYLQEYPLITLIILSFTVFVVLIIKYLKRNQYIVIIIYKERLIIMNKRNLYHLIKPYENKQNINLNDLLFLLDLYQDNFVK